MKLSVILFTGFWIVFIIVSKIIFDNVYLTSNMIVDEEFHLPLGECYCKFKFNEWDPKVTTLPGLYLISSAIFGPLKLCSIYWLRMTSLVFSAVNLVLFYILFSKYAQGDWRNIFSSVTLALLPPLYFLSHLYYTDVVSLTMNLATLVLSETGHHYFASIFGVFAVMCRQTNIISVAIYATKYVLVELYTIWRQNEALQKKEGKMPASNIIPFIIDVIKKPMSILSKTNLQFWLNVLSYSSLLVAFIAFVLINGSIVVGDKAAHEVTIHIPQIFYFSLFCLIFGWPHFVGDVLRFTVFAKRHKVFILICLVLGLVIVHFNTEIHPYLLADNRHYIFYVWNRFYGRYFWFKYAMVPIYIFGLYVIVKNVCHKDDVSFGLAYLPAMAILLMSQRLVEIRYYIVPYILLRLHVKNTDSAVFNIVLEFITYCIVNMITFNIFFTKTVEWVDMDYPQRIMW